MNCDNELKTDLNVSIMINDCQAIADSVKNRPEKCIEVAWQRFEYRL